MKRFIVYQVIDAEHEDDLALAIERAESAIEAQGARPQFIALREGYGGEFAHLGADPTSWDPIVKHGPACECSICDRLGDGHHCSGVQVLGVGQHAKCGGWYIQNDGALKACKSCKLFTDDEVKDVIAVLVEIHGIDLTTEGWCVVHANEERWEIEKCDDAGILPDDDAALVTAVTTLGAVTGCWVGPREPLDASEAHAS